MAQTLATWIRTALPRPGAGLLDTRPILAPLLHRHDEAIRQPSNQSGSQGFSGPETALSGLFHGLCAGGAARAGNPPASRAGTSSSSAFSVANHAAPAGNHEHAGYITSPPTRHPKIARIWVHLIGYQADEFGHGDPSADALAVPIVEDVHDELVHLLLFLDVLRQTQLVHPPPPPMGSATPASGGDGRSSGSRHQLSDAWLHEHTRLATVKPSR